MLLLDIVNIKISCCIPPLRSQRRLEGQQREDVVEDEQLEAFL